MSLLYFKANYSRFKQESIVVRSKQCLLMFSEALLDNSVVSYILLGCPCVLYEIPGYLISHTALAIPYEGIPAISK